MLPVSNRMTACGPPEVGADLHILLPTRGLPPNGRPMKKTLNPNGCSWAPQPPPIGKQHPPYFPPASAPHLCLQRRPHVAPPHGRAERHVLAPQLPLAIEVLTCQNVEILQGDGHLGHLVETSGENIWEHLVETLSRGRKAWGNIEDQNRMTS